MSFLAHVSEDVVQREKRLPEVHTTQAGKVKKSKMKGQTDTIDKNNVLKNDQECGTGL